MWKRIGVGLEMGLQSAKPKQIVGKAPAQNNNIHWFPRK